MKPAPATAGSRLERARQARLLRAGSTSSAAPETTSPSRISRAARRCPCTTDSPSTSSTTAGDGQLPRPAAALRAPRRVTRVAGVRRRGPRRARCDRTSPAGGRRIARPSRSTIRRRRGVRRHAGDREVAMAVAGADARRHDALRLDGEDPGQARQRVRGIAPTAARRTTPSRPAARRPRTASVISCPWRRRTRSRRPGSPPRSAMPTIEARRADRLAREVAQHHARRRCRVTGDDRRSRARLAPVARRRLRPHGLGRRNAHRAAHGRDAPSAAAASVMARGAERRRRSGEPVAAAPGSGRTGCRGR